MKSPIAEKRIARMKRAARTRSKLRGTSSIPRLSVFRSGKHIYAQLVDDEAGKTIASASDLDLTKGEKGKKAPPGDTAERVGKLIAERGKEHKVVRAVFDRGGYQYHGRVKALADGARKGGLKF